jgi:hypothetical protein
MSKKDRKQLSILVVLLAVLGLTIAFGYRMVSPPVASTIQPPEPKKTSANPPAASEARIRLDLVEKSEEAGQENRRRNLFQYGQAPAPPQPVGRGSGSLVPGPNSAPPVNVMSTPVPTVRPGPPAPPPVPLKYQGFATTPSPNGGFIAFLADDARHYNVTAGEVLMGRFRILGITDKSVEIEDLDYNRRQTLPLIK